MSVAAVSCNTDYQEAVKATDIFDSPAIGFAKTSDYRIGVSNQQSAIIKQNNTLIYLLAKQSQRLSDLESTLEKIKRQLEARKEVQSSDLGDSISSLSQRLDKLSLGGQPGPRKKGPIYVYTDPGKIFEKEYSKERK